VAIGFDTKHFSRNIPPATFLLQGVETLQDDAFPVGETVSDVGEIVTRITGRHMKVLPRRVYREFRADVLQWDIPKFFSV
jgi:hypothetical protein